MFRRMKEKLIKFLNRRPESAFTLIEMLTVCAIIGILATMAIASMRGGKGIAYETMCIGALKHINENEQLFFNRHNHFTDWRGLIVEGDLLDPGYAKNDNLRDPLDTPIAIMYSLQFYAYSATFSVIAYPVDTAVWNLRTFAVDSDGSILNSKDNPDYPGFRP
jgi:prepilin-type N-terminal cleavage/methylation domain-containing protein